MNESAENLEQEESEQEESVELDALELRGWMRWAPFGLFVGGFFFDIATLGREVTALSLVVIGLYASAIVVGLWLKSVELPPRVRRVIYLGIHFCLGSLFSALAVLYFRSAGHFFSLLIVLGLFAAMVWNEFSHREESQRELIWGIFCVSLVMYFNFLLPHLVGSVAPVLFYISTVLALTMLWGLRVVAEQPWKTTRLAHGGAVLIVVFYIMGWIPPVPLVIENSLVGMEFERSNSEYSVEVYEPRIRDRLRVGPRVVERRDGEAVYILTSVSAPTGAEVALEHRWYHRDDGKWVRTDTIPINIRGGRQAGWRFYSMKRNLSEGVWKVETALVDGAILGYQRFYLRDGAEDPPLRRARQEL